MSERELDQCWSCGIELPKDGRIVEVVLKANQFTERPTNVLGRYHLQCVGTRMITDMSKSELENIEPDPTPDQLAG